MNALIAWFARRDAARRAEWEADRPRREYLTAQRLARPNHTPKGW